MMQHWSVTVKKYKYEQLILFIACCITLSPETLEQLELYFSHHFNFNVFILAVHSAIYGGHWPAVATPLTSQVSTQDQWAANTHPAKTQPQ